MSGHYEYSVERTTYKYEGEPEQSVSRTQVKGTRNDDGYASWGSLTLSPDEDQIQALQAREYTQSQPWKSRDSWASNQEMKRGSTYQSYEMHSMDTVSNSLSHSQDEYSQDLRSILRSARDSPRSPIIHPTKKRERKERPNSSGSNSSGYVVKLDPPAVQHAQVGVVQVGVATPLKSSTDRLAPPTSSSSQTTTNRNSGTTTMMKTSWHGMSPPNSPLFKDDIGKSGPDETDNTVISLTGSKSRDSTDTLMDAQVNTPVLLILGAPTEAQAQSDRELNSLQHDAEFQNLPKQRSSIRMNIGSDLKLPTRSLTFNVGGDKYRGDYDHTFDYSAKTGQITPLEKYGKHMQFPTNKNSDANIVAYTAHVSGKHGKKFDDQAIAVQTSQVTGKHGVKPKGIMKRPKSFSATQEKFVPPPFVMRKKEPEKKYTSVINTSLTTTQNPRVKSYTAWKKDKQYQPHSVRTTARVQPSSFWNEFDRLDRDTKLSTRDDDENTMTSEGAVSDDVFMYLTPVRARSAPQSPATSPPSSPFPHRRARSQSLSHKRLWSRSRSLDRHLSSPDQKDYYKLCWQYIRGLEKEQDKEYWRVLQDRGLMSNIGEDPNEYLPRDTRESQHTSIKVINNNTSQYDQSAALNESSSTMNGPTSVAMYERQSPNPAHMSSHVMANDSMYGQHSYQHQPSTGFNYHDQRFLPAGSESGGGGIEDSYPYPSSSAAPTSSSLPPTSAHYTYTDSPMYGAGPQLHDGAYQGLSFTEREPQGQGEGMKEAPYEPLYMHSRDGGGVGEDDGGRYGYQDGGMGYPDAPAIPNQGYDDGSMNPGFHDGMQNYDGLQGQYDGPLGQYDDPQGQFDGPQGQFEGPQGQFDGPQGQYDGPQGYVDGPPHTQGYTDGPQGYDPQGYDPNDPNRAFDSNQGYNDNSQFDNPPQPQPQDYDPNSNESQNYPGYDDNQGYPIPDQGYPESGERSYNPGENAQGLDSFDQQFQYRDESTFQHNDTSQYGYQGNNQHSNYVSLPPNGPDDGNYGNNDNSQNYGGVNGVTERFGHLQMDSDRYSDRDAPSEGGVGYGVSYSGQNDSYNPGGPPARIQDESFQGQGSGYYGGGGANEDPYATRAEMVGAYQGGGDRFDQSPQPSPHGVHTEHIVHTQTSHYADNRSQSPAIDPRGPPYGSNSHLNGPADVQGSQSHLGNYAVGDNTGFDQSQHEYGMGRENYERQESSQYSRQNSMRLDPNQLVGMAGGSQRNLTGSQSHLRAHSPMEPPLAQGSQDHLVVTEKTVVTTSTGASFPAGSQSQLNRSMEGSMVRLAGAQNGGNGSMRGSQLLTVTETQKTTIYDRFRDLHNESEIPRQDSIRLAQGGYNLELLRKSPTPSGAGGERKWRDPSLPEVIQYLSHPNPNINANAAAYLQHLCFMDDTTKSQTRELGGIPALVNLVKNDIPEVHRAACGALRNLSYGRVNDDNKLAIKNAAGIPALFSLLEKTPDNDIKELVTGILWNLSSHPEVKKSIYERAHVDTLVKHVLLPHSQMDRYYPSLPPPDAVVWSTVFRNASGVLRNVSSDGAEARKVLRETPNLVDCTLYLLRAAIGQNDIDNKSVENCVCMLRNLSFACQEVHDPMYLQNREKQAKAQAKGEATGCFGQKSSKKQKQEKAGAHNPPVKPYIPSTKPGEPVRGKEKLWEPEVVSVYLPLLSDCTNPETLEAAAGAIQNLSACDWEPSVNIRSQVRKEKALPILVELLNLEADRVVCASATALRNLAIDPKNNELIGKYAMKQLIAKLPSEQRDSNEYPVSDETICAVEATIYEVIKHNEEHARTLLQNGGCERLMHIMSSKGKYQPKVVKFASTILYTMWQYKDMHPEYKKRNWTQANFITKTMAAKTQNMPAGKTPPQSQANTLQRPSMGQSGPTAAGYNENTMAHVPRQPGERPYMGERTPQLNNSRYGSQQRLQANGMAMSPHMGPGGGSIHNLHTSQQQLQHSPTGGYYDSQRQHSGQYSQQGGYAPHPGGPTDPYDPARQDSYRPGSQQGGYDDRQNSYMRGGGGSERGGGGGGNYDRQDSYTGQNSYRQGAPPSDHGNHRQDSYHGGAPQSEQGNYPGQDSYRQGPPSEHDGGYRQDSYRGPPSEQGGYRQESYRQGPPSEHGSYRPGPNDMDGPYAQVTMGGGGGPPSEHGSYRADPYAQVGQFDRYGGDDGYGRGPPDGIEPQRNEYGSSAPLFPAGHTSSQEGMVANEPLYARVNKEKRRPEFPPDSNIGYDGQDAPPPGGAGGGQGADSWV